MFDEQIGWAVDAGVDFIIGETYSYAAEAELAAQAIREAGLPAAVTMAVHRDRHGEALFILPMVA